MSKPAVPAIARLPTATGAVVMAGGIFGAASLQHIPGGAALTLPLTVLLALIWLVAALSFACSHWHGIFARHTATPLASFGIGTWIAASAVLARMMMVSAAPRAVADALLILAFLIWAWFVPLAVRNLALLWASRSDQPDGSILLLTVSTQAVAIMGLRLFPALSFIRPAALGLIAAGALFYLAGLGLILRRYLCRGRWRLVTDWRNTNCILHGALSITGLAAIVSGAFAAPAIARYWAGVAIVFVAVEAIEASRLVLRLRGLGLRRGLFTYDLSQWARNFTFGMFYAFTLAFALRDAIGPAHPLLAALRAGVLAYGQYVVAVLLGVEIVLLIAARPRA